jgi:mRNA-degrading endonuclease RelE of RelBE toxin-antitoxin system
MNHFTLHIPNEIAAQLRRCRVSIRRSIRKRLQEIVQGLAIADPSERKTPVDPGAPHLRFYVYEGYRVSYEVDPASRKVVVLKLRTESV